MPENATGPEAGPRPLRRDAERNRQRILEAAAEVFNERGLDVSLDEIARHAGVGVGTVYRRFRTKEELVEALFMDRLDHGRGHRRPGPRGSRSRGPAWCPSWSGWPRSWRATSGCGRS